eukprot:2145904-Amphidinium_carterae.1
MMMTEGLVLSDDEQMHMESGTDLTVLDEGADVAMTTGVAMLVEDDTMGGMLLSDNEQIHMESGTDLMMTDEEADVPPPPEPTAIPPPVAPDEETPTVDAPAPVRRRLRGKQPPPLGENDELIALAAPPRIRRRVQGKQPPPADEKDDLLEQVCWITDRLRPNMGGRVDTSTPGLRR